MMERAKPATTSALSRPSRIAADAALPHDPAHHAVAGEEQDQPLVASGGDRPRRPLDRHDRVEAERSGRVEADSRGHEVALRGRVEHVGGRQGDLGGADARPLRLDRGRDLVIGARAPVPQQVADQDGGPNLLDGLAELLRDGGGQLLAVGQGIADRSPCGVVASSIAPHLARSVQWACSHRRNVNEQKEPAASAAWGQ